MCGTHDVRTQDLKNSQRTMLRRNRGWRMPACASPLTSRDSRIYAPSKDRRREVNARIYEPSRERTFAALLDEKTGNASTTNGEESKGEKRTWLKEKRRRKRRIEIQVALDHLRNLLTPLAPRGSLFFARYTPFLAVDSRIALSTDSTIQFHDP